MCRQPNNMHTSNKCTLYLFCFRLFEFVSGFNFLGHNIQASVFLTHYAFVSTTNALRSLLFNFGNHLFLEGLASIVLSSITISWYLVEETVWTWYHKRSLTVEDSSLWIPRRRPGEIQFDIGQAILLQGIPLLLFTLSPLILYSEIS